MAATRRESLKALLTAVGAGATPLALVERALAASGPTPAFHSAEEMALLTRLCDLLLPETATPGAISAGVPKLLDTLMLEWASAESRAEHRAHLATCATVLSDGGRHFPEQPVDGARARLAAFDQSAYGDAAASEAAGGWRALKTLITRAYFATEPGSRQELDWRLVPGRWIPCQELPA